MTTPPTKPTLRFIKGGRKGPKTPRNPKLTLKLVVPERKVS